MSDPIIQDLIGGLYSIYNLNGATFQDHNGQVFTLTSASSGLRAGGGGGGRLTLTADTPVMISSAPAATVIRYTPYVSDIVSIYNGTSFVPYSFAELSNTTTASSTGSAGPAAVANNSNYDLFVWLSGSTVTLTRGPAWTSDTARGTGAGTTQLTRTKGTLLNTVAITNGPGALLGTYVGTVRSNGTATIDWIFGAIAATPTAGVFGVWNMYNRVDVSSGLIGDSADEWVYNTASFEAAHNQATFRASFIRGFDEDRVTAEYGVSVKMNTQLQAIAAIGLDSTTAMASPGCRPGWFFQNSANVVVTASYWPITARYSGLPGLGWHYLSALEFSTGATTTWSGDEAAPTLIQSGLDVLLRA